MPRDTRQPRDPRPPHHRHGHGQDRLPWWLRPEPTPSRNRSLRPREEVIADLVDTAIRVADAEGIDAVSMRRIARDMGMGTMSLYWYVDGKDDLFDLVFDRIMADQLLAERDLGNWRTGLKAIARQSRAIFDEHPWLIGVMGDRHFDGPNAIRHIDQSLRVTDGLGLTMQQRLVMLTVIDDFVVGRVRRDAAQQQRSADAGFSKDEWLEKSRPFIERLIDEEGLERLRELIDQRPEVDVDLFEEGLAVVIDGLAARFALG